MGATIRTGKDTSPGNDMSAQGTWSLLITQHELTFAGDIPIDVKLRGLIQEFQNKLEQLDGIMEEVRRKFLTWGSHTGDIVPLSRSEDIIMKSYGDQDWDRGAITSTEPWMSDELSSMILRLSDWLEPHEYIWMGGNFEAFSMRNPSRCIHPNWHLSDIHVML